MKVTHYRWLCLSGAVLMVGPLMPIAPRADEAYTGTSYGGKAAEVPGIIQAELYDVAPGAANGIAFNYNGAIRPGAQRTTADCIGLGTFGKGHVSTVGVPEDAAQMYVGWTHSGEWLKYTLHVAEAGVYRVGGKFSVANKGGKLSFGFGSENSTGPVEIPTTAGFQPGVEVYHVWEKLDNLAEVKLPAGTMVMKVKIETSGGFNLDYFTLAKK